MSYTHLSTFDRGRLESLHKLGWSTREIAQELKRHHSTIARELQRNQINNSYTSQQAQKTYEQRRRKSKPTGKWSTSLATIINRKLKLTWSPEQIVGRLFQRQLSYKTIYRWIYQGLLIKGNLALLRHKGKRQKPKETRGRFNVGTSIHKRPKDVKKRLSFGHWELDTVVSSRGKSKGCLATFAERKTRIYLALPMEDRTAGSMEMAIRTLHGFYPIGTFKTATVDRGKEFACYPSIEKDLNLPIYFADPYSSWQRGTNENSNGLLREFFPKATDLAKVSENQVATALALINSRPRKCLNWKTPHEAFIEELSHLT
ncbi:transposase, IS30 family [Desulfitobacterium dehalogenans ATCC 51507]|uniref:Transposase, IS30 family n=1 Tax=Desulfitobacterium dehalogenans (strain ATCC 51507 / DSM 9161 / JW/IU-DC1) TaxID=756499 RepID=I4A9Z8_DESDJ|nr:IS30 family transposase [Desulfitobacterium dehalogenans]AFM00783.1 transposase, IS30 family [Desulfitobacterium dehalogenans ATCC 51507]